MTDKTCLFITESGTDDIAIFAHIVCNSSLTFLEIIAGINQHLHTYHDKVYYYPEIDHQTAKSIIETYAEGYPIYTITVKRGVIE